MQPVKVLVTNRKGREINPHTYYENDMFLSYAYIKFKEEHPEYPAPNLPDGEHECELTKQYTIHSSPERAYWADCSDEDYEYFIGEGYPTRQIYTLYQPVEKTNSAPKVCGQDCGCLDMADCHFKVEKEVKTEEEKSLEVAAAEYFEADINDLGLCDKIFINGAKFGLAYADQQTASLRNEVERYRDGLKTISDKYNRGYAHASDRILADIDQLLTQPK